MDSRLVLFGSLRVVAILVVLCQPIGNEFIQALIRPFRPAGFELLFQGQAILLQSR